MLKLLNKKIYIIVFVISPLMSSCSIAACASNVSPARAIPVDAISGILAAFDTHSVVALGEGNHNNEQGQAFRLSLIRDPRFSAIVKDIVVEFGNARYQDIMDRFVSGEEVLDSELSKVWQNTTQCHSVWDVPIYQEFFQAVRMVNASLPKDRRLRVLLGDPPIDWDRIDVEDFDKFMAERDSHPAALIQKEVIAKGRRALVIYGDNHFLRKEIRFVGVTDECLSEGRDAPSLVALLERSPGIHVFTIKSYTAGGDIGTLQDDIRSWPQPSLINFHRTVLGTQDYGFYYPGVVMIKLVDGKPQSFKVQPGIKMEEQFDALLYLGPLSVITYSELSVEQCSDSAYVEMRKKRMAVYGNIEWANAFQNFCEKKAGIGVEKK